jgi:hypothetical protein
MKTKEDILKPYIERIGRHTEIVDKDNALQAMELYGIEIANWYAEQMNKNKEAKTAPTPVLPFPVTDLDRYIKVCTELNTFQGSKWSLKKEEFNKMELPAGMKILLYNDDVCTVDRIEIEKFGYFKWENNAFHFYPWPGNWAGEGDTMSGQPVQPPVHYETEPPAHYNLSEMEKHASLFISHNKSQLDNRKAQFEGIEQAYKNKAVNIKWSESYIIMSFSIDYNGAYVWNGQCFSWLPRSNDQVSKSIVSNIDIEKHGKTFDYLAEGGFDDLLVKITELNQLMMDAQKWLNKKIEANNEIQNIRKKMDDFKNSL